MSDTRTVNVLSIDAWAAPHGWDWNNWFKVGTIDEETLTGLDTDEKVAEWMKAEGYIRETAQLGKDFEIEDDQHNLVICDRSVIDAPEDCDDSERCEHTHSARPIFAIAYGDLH